jgi:hypothetical protein
VDISLKDFVPDAVTVDSHYYKVALATDILANCRDAAAKRCMIDIPITIPPLSHINPYIDAETRWTEGLKKAREASAFADSCMAKEEASPFDYSCPDYVIKAENNAWLAISDIPRDRLTKSEIAYVDTLIKQNQ